MKVWLQEVVKGRALAGTEELDFSFLRLTGRNLYHNKEFFGEKIVVAVVDSGVSKHPELEGRILPGFNSHSYYHDRSDATDDHGHGTHVAASIAGTVCGIAPAAKILPVKVLGGDGSASIEEVITGLQFIRDWRDENDNTVDIVNMSLSCPGSYLERSPIGEAFHNIIKELVSMGILVVAASGNTGKEEVQYPAHYQEVVAVGAVDITEKVTFFSTRNKEVDVCQLGVGVLSANYTGGYIKMSGTSMASPLVSGIGALIAGRYQKIFGTKIAEPDLYTIMKFSTIDIGVPGVDVESGAGFCTLNTDPYKIEFVIDSKIMTVNGVSQELDVPPQIVNGRTLVPLRAPFEAAGGDVEWIGKERRVIINI